MSNGTGAAEREAAAVKQRVAARDKKAKENIARLSAQGPKRRRCRAGTAATIAPGFGGHGDRGSGGDDVEIGPLLPDPFIWQDLCLTSMTIWRWDRDPAMIALGWPPPIYRGRYKHRDANQYRKFKANLLQQAIKRRNALLRNHDTKTTQGEDAIV